jgi:hypothetical protein
MTPPSKTATTPWLSDAVAAVILAGGKNSRMGGADKAFLTVDGQTAFNAPWSCALFSQVVASNRPEYAPFDVEVTPDEFRGRPVGGHPCRLRIGPPSLCVRRSRYTVPPTGTDRLLIRRIGARAAIALVGRRY